MAHLDSLKMMAFPDITPMFFFKSAILELKFFRLFSIQSITSVNSDPRSTCVRTASSLSARHSIPEIVPFWSRYVDSSLSTMPCSPRREPDD